MEHPPTPHPPGEALRHYALGTLPPESRCRLEPHLEHCAPCRSRLVPFVDATAVERNWHALDRAIDLPTPGPWERVLLALGVPDDAARLLTATPALRATWLLGTCLTLVFAALTVRLAEPGGPPLIFLTVAPLLPAAGIAGTLGGRLDPGYELGRVAAPSAFRLVLLRTAVVLATTALLTAAASLVLPRWGPAAFGWLLPSCLLTVTSLLLLPRIGSLPAAATTSVAWLSAVTLTRHSGALFSLPGQSVLAVLLLIALTLLILLRADFDFQKGIRL
ncbi:zf-HC2 domain-containing protein [Streptomyces albipurpureus]|uniref:Zf-HC2 domain-containing protein n=1 Tax=Streptomyces albipurpureus TaxID=2897419 RepID=A0ABT0UFT4_9ACTN|nr:zf-HC2 domain-containing protein [Streptomyces sp. CWNU-1]MCM2386859.1 zf-HC2 domain-containing protein [Streptomyces sp. CWNU-1]